MIAALMFSAAERIQRKSHAMILVAALFAGWLAGPAALSIRAEDTCGMPCCIQAGHCCCAAKHSHVEGEGSDGRDHLKTPVAASRCPDGCGNGSFSRQIFSADAVANASRSFELVTSGYQWREFLRVKLDLKWIGFSTSRAPPTTRLN